MIDLPNDLIFLTLNLAALLAAFFLLCCVLIGRVLDVGAQND